MTFAERRVEGGETMAKITEEERERRKREARLRQQAEIDEIAREIAAKAPPLTEGQKRELARLLCSDAGKRQHP